MGAYHLSEHALIYINTKPRGVVPRTKFHGVALVPSALKPTIFWALEPKAFLSDLL
jgi:hypothetical protein